MAKAFPEFALLRFRRPSRLDRRRARARRCSEGLGDRVSFAVATGENRVLRNGYDLVCFFDCLHDMGDPVGALRARARDAWPMTAPACWSSRSPTTGLKTISRRSDACSTRRRPWSARRPRWRRRSGLALGAQAGEARLREVARQGGFTAIQARDGDAVQSDTGGTEVTACVPRMRMRHLFMPLRRAGPHTPLSHT